MQTPVGDPCAGTPEPAPSGLWAAWRFGAGLKKPVWVTGGPLMWSSGCHLRVAVAVGFIALAGVAAETGVVMILYLDEAWQHLKQNTPKPTFHDLYRAVMEGAVLRVRPKMMTVTAIIAGLLPIMWGHGTGSLAMKRIAAPMVGGMVSSTILTLLIIPVIFLMWRRRLLRSAETHLHEPPDYHRRGDRRCEVKRRLLAQANAGRNGKAEARSGHSVGRSRGRARQPRLRTRAIRGRDQIQAQCVAISPSNERDAKDSKRSDQSEGFSLRRRSK